MSDLVGNENVVFLIRRLIFLNLFSSNNCLIDFAYPDDIAAYQEHLTKLPGERHDLDSQCKLIQGKDSKLCEVCFPGSFTSS